MVTPCTKFIFSIFFLPIPIQKMTTSPAIKLIYNNPLFDTYLNDKISEYVMWNDLQQWKQDIKPICKDLIRKTSSITSMLKDGRHFDTYFNKGRIRRDEESWRLYIRY
jgi:hypothetical protein